uniref:60S RIBOSOMAL PROTEIN L6 n=1 Tax=Anncaliia algerae TaxID=723287 RepID=E3PYF3_9MICR|nr:60S RIBOSOMAL PROTEIN L6 [Anncaliia algerae]
MADLKKNYVTINNRQIRVLPERAGYYPADDMPLYLQKLEERNKPKERESRKDLVQGMVIVALEGEFAAKRVVFLKQVDGFKALCCGPEPINKVPFFLIDERFLLKTSTVLDLKVDCENIDINSVFECNKDLEISSNKTSNMVKIEEEVLKSVKKVKFMRCYLETLFNINENDGKVPTTF